MSKLTYLLTYSHYENVYARAPSRPRTSVCLRTLTPQSFRDATGHTLACFIKQQFLYAHCTLNVSCLVKRNLHHTGKNINYRLVQCWCTSSASSIQRRLHYIDVGYCNVVDATVDQRVSVRDVICAD